MSDLTPERIADLRATCANSVRRELLDEVERLRAELVASEKARADLLHALVCRNDPLQGAAYRDLADRVISAERAGGA